jgi:7 transmembrane receptor (rhodopsin family)
VDGLPHDYGLCTISVAIVANLYWAVILSLLVVSIDRFWAVCFPFSYRKINSKRVSLALTSFPWIISIGTACWDFISYESKEKYVRDCGATEILTNVRIMVESTLYICICLIMATTYAVIFRRISHQVRAKVKLKKIRP